jgi:hypothetical protein
MNIEKKKKVTKKLVETHTYLNALFHAISLTTQKNEEKRKKKKFIHKYIIAVDENVY